MSELIVGYNIWKLIWSSYSCSIFTIVKLKKKKKNYRIMVAFDSGFSFIALPSYGCTGSHRTHLVFPRVFNSYCFIFILLFRWFYDSRTKNNSSFKIGPFLVNLNIILFLAILPSLCCPCQSVQMRYSLPS